MESSPSNDVANDPYKMPVGFLDDPDRKRLIILDICGLLCHKHYCEGRSGSDVAADLKDLGLRQIILDKFIIHVRPYAQDFLDYCFSIADVGFFSSTTSQNGRTILEALVPDKQRQKIKFYWYRDRTRLDPDFGSDSLIGVYDTIKCLEDVYNSPYINKDRCYGSHNTITVDDSLQKVRFNHQLNRVVVDSYDLTDVIATSQLSRPRGWEEQQEQEGPRSTDTKHLDDYFLICAALSIRAKFNLMLEKLEPANPAKS